MKRIKNILLVIIGAFFLTNCEITPISSDIGSTSSIGQITSEDPTTDGSTSTSSEEPTTDSDVTSTTEEPTTSEEPVTSSEPTTSSDEPTTTSSEPTTSESSSSASETSEQQLDFWSQPEQLQYSLPEVIDASYYNNCVSLPSLGDQKVLVIPVEFTDYTCDDTEKGCEDTKTDIENAMFGKAEDTGWESLSSFYSKSSYGKLNLTGTVTDWFDAGVTMDQFDRLTQYGDPTYYVLRNAINWYKGVTGSNLREYDQNNDGYLDAVYLIYSAEIDYTGDSSFWAYTYWDYERNPSTTSPIANVYAWSSYAFMYEKTYSQGPDAHTYIHEFGHVLGLDDYYTYDSDDWGAAGGVDMMDYNIGDHNAYSKMVLGWITPIVIENSGTLDLAPFQESGDAVLLRDSTWNGSAFDEYLLLEFYTPTGLNASDVSGYNGISTFNKSGIKVLHIDSRLLTTARYAYEDYYTDDLLSDDEYYTEIAASNTSSDSYDSSCKLIHLLEQSGSNSLRNGNIAYTNALFQAGKNFGVNVFRSYTFNDSSKLGYTFLIDSINNDGARITFTKL